MLSSFAPVVLFWRCQPDCLARNNVFMNKERFQLSENLRSARCSPFVISKVLAAPTRKLITARAHKNKRAAHMLANARRDHSIPLLPVSQTFKPISLNLLWLAAWAGKMNQTCAVIGYPRWQDGAILLNQDHLLCPARNAAWSRWLETGLILFCEFMDLDSISAYKHAKTELGQCLAMLTSLWSITPIRSIFYMICFCSYNNSINIINKTDKMDT